MSGDSSRRHFIHGSRIYLGVLPIDAVQAPDQE